MDEELKRMTDRFLCWPMPKTVCSDGCVTTKDYPYQRVGTNLLTADEARQMLEYVALPLLQAKQAKIDALMLEYCPTEITKEQFEEWGKHQVPSED